MSTDDNCNLLPNNNEIWIVRRSRFSDIELSAMIDERVEGPYKEYNISDICRYLINPHAIEVKKKLIGCEIHYRQSPFNKIWNSIQKILPASSQKRKKNKSLSPEMIVSRDKLQIPNMKDPELKAYLNEISDRLKSYDTVSRRLAQIDPRNLLLVFGICEEVGGNYSYLRLQGSVEEKIKYVGNSMAKEVGVVLKKAYVAEGLYELRGYDFTSYNPAKSYRVFSYHNGSEQKACVLTGHNKVEFYITDNRLLKHMVLLEQSLKANPGLSKAFELCISGQANPIKLFFNKKLEIDYSKTYLPAIYEEELKKHNIGSNQRDLIKPILNDMQIGISLNYTLVTDDRDDQMFTHVSVLQDFRALEPLRENLPDVYAAVSKHGFVTESGRYYLLDSFTGCKNA